MHEEVIDAEIIEQDAGTVDALSIVAFTAALLPIVFPINAVLAIVLGAIARAQRRRSARVGYGLARAAVIIGVAQLLLGAVLVALALGSLQARAAEAPQPTQVQTVCIAHPLACANAGKHALEGVHAVGGAVKELFAGLAG